MPFRSKRQLRWMHAAEARGEVPKGTAKRWREETPSVKALPGKAKKKKKRKKRRKNKWERAAERRRG